MSIEIREVGVDHLPQYVKVPTAFEVRSIFRVDLVDEGLGGMALREEALAAPYVKDYDGQAGEGPERWAKRFDVSNWGFFLALEETFAVGGAAVAFNTPGVHMLRGRKDLAALWDIRVHPSYRRRGIGTELVRRAADWSRERGCVQLKIETQSVNVPGCRLYAKQGCQLGEINRYGYAGHPRVGHEVMLVWYLDL